MERQKKSECIGNGPGITRGRECVSLDAPHVVRFYVKGKHEVIFVYGWSLDNNDVPNALVGDGGGNSTRIDRLSWPGVRC